MKTKDRRHVYSTLKEKSFRVAFIIFTLSAILADPGSAGTVHYLNVDTVDTSLEDLTISLNETEGTQSITPTEGLDIAYSEKYERSPFSESTNITGTWNFSVHLMTSVSKSATGAPYANIYKFEDGSETLLYNGSADKPADKTFSNSDTVFTWSQDLSNVVIGANTKIRVQIIFKTTSLAGGFSGTVDLKYGTTTYNSQVEITNKSATSGTLGGTFNNVAPAEAKIGQKKVKTVNFTLSSSSGYVDINTITVRLKGVSTNHSIRFVRLIRDDNSNNEADPTDAEIGIEEFNYSRFAVFGTPGTVLDSLAENSNKQYFILYDISSIVGTGEGETVGVKLDDGDITISLGSFGTMNYPYNSTNITIVEQPQDEAANIYGFLNKPAYLFGNFSGGEYTAGGGEDPGIPSVDDNLIWPGSAHGAVLGAGAAWRSALNQEFMIESTTIRAMLYVTDGRGRSKQGQRVNAWIINNLGQKINNSNVTNANGRTVIEFWGWPDWGNSTTGAKVWPTHSGQNITVDGVPTTQESQYIYARFKSREYFYVYVDFDDDGEADYEMPFMAYTMFDTYPWTDKKDVKHCENSNRESHDHQGNTFEKRALGEDPDTICPDCHGWSSEAGPSPISTNIDPRPLLKYSTTHPFPKSPKAVDCVDPNCHPGYEQTSQPIPGYPAQTHNITNEAYPNTSVCNVPGCHITGGRGLPYVDDIIPVNDEGHCYINDIPEVTKGVACKYCHNYNFHFQVEREKIPAFVLIPEGRTTNDGNYPGTCFEGCHITVAWHNNSVACEECHFNLAKAPMHQIDLKVNRKLCYQDCHGNYTLTTLKSKDNTSLGTARVWLNTTWRHSTEDNNGSKWNTSLFNVNNYPGKFYWNSSETDFPQDACEFCHSDEHSGAVFIVKHPMGKLFQFNGYNILNSEINHTSNWCSGCHWQGYRQNTTITWDDMFQAFNETYLPIPPEISGNATHAPISGSNPGPNGITDFVNHSDWFMNNGTGADFSDAMCFDCHANGIKITDGHKMFQHNVTIGFGGPECSSCHNSTLKGITEPAGIKRLDSRIMENISWVHFNLSNRTGADKSYVRPIEAACWACHNTSSGDRPVPSEHPGSYKQPRNCTDCHTNGNYGAPIIVEHVPGGYNASSEIKLRTPQDYCTRCHNNSILEYSSLETTDFNSNANATIGHYATNITLMTQTNNSKNCTWCHFQNSDSIAWSTPVDPRINYSSLHTGIVDNDCYGCHVQGGTTTVNSAGWTFHDVSVGKGVSGGVNCTNCHDINGAQNNVNFTAVSLSIHATLNSGAQATSQNASNKPCWGCHGTKVGTWANESDQPAGDHNGTYYRNPRECYDCHITNFTQFTTKNVTDHIPSGFTDAGTDVNTSSYNKTYCTYCHNNSVNSGFEPDDMGLSGSGSIINASVSHYGANRTSGKLMSPVYNSTNCVFCHINSSNMFKWGIIESSLSNISNKNGTAGTGANHISYITDDLCISCHGGYIVTEDFTFHDSELGPGAGGGPNCIGCHDIGGSAKNTIVNFSTMNDSGAIHKNLNSGVSTLLDPGNKKCWACHGDGSEPGSDHPVNYKAPFNCTDCHTTGGSQSGKYPAGNVTEHLKAGTTAGTEIFTPGADDCYSCHNMSEMMIFASDPDNGTGEVYGGLHGGNDSVSHYGMVRDLGPGDAYCNYCHSNTTSPFYLSVHNRSIIEHTTNASANISNSTTLECIDCHGQGSIHNTTLLKPVQNPWTSGQNDYCSPCHSSTGDANKKVYDQGHDPVNSSTDNITNCNYCHDSGSPGDTSSSYPLGVHSENLTIPAGTSTCAGCHNGSSVYVKTLKILTHLPGVSRDKGNTSLSGRTCELCHGIAGQSMHAQGMIKKPAYGCEDCHVSSGSGPFWANQSFDPYIDITSHDNSTTSNVTDCNWCHNNPDAPEPFHFTEWANGSIENPAWGGWQAGNPVNCTDCHDSVNSDQAPFYGPDKPHAETGNNTDECYDCHTKVKTYSEAPLAVHSVVQAPGNANCTQCHDIGGAASKEVDVAAMNRSDSIHLDLNSGAVVSNATAPYAADSKRCWACHGDGSDKNEHDQVRYKNPYTCEDCHTTGGTKSGTYPSFNVSEHTISGVEIKTQNASSCSDCHSVDEMLISNADTEILSPDASTGHYGRKRILDGNDYPLEDTIEYCDKCHNNATTVFPFIDNSNKSIANHSLNYPSLNPSCLDTECHSTGRIHNSSLGMSKVDPPNSTYCTDNCHGYGGSATIKDLERHNDSSPDALDCTGCHMNSSKSIHPVRYLNQDGMNWDNTNGSAVNCTTCHQGSVLTGFESAIMVPAPINHSTNPYSGNLWGNFWDNNSQQDSCSYCHGNISYHNSSGLGLVLTVKGTNNVRMGFSGTWCSNCHYNGAPDYSVSAFSPPPPEITTSTASNDPNVTWYDHTPDVASNYTDAKCKECHDNNLSAGATSLNFTHDLGPAGGGPDCVACHDTGKGSAMVDVNSIAGSMHWNLKNVSASDTTSTPVNKICWACHQSDGTQPQEHPDRKSNPYNCTDCHINDSRPAFVSGALQVDNHYKSGNNITALTGSSTNDTSCIDCHILSEMIAPYAEPDSSWNNNSLTSHYGKNRTDLKILNEDDYCNYCHNNVSSVYDYENSHNKEIFEHTASASADIRNVTTMVCVECHATDKAWTGMHNSTLTTPQVDIWTQGKEDYCAPCHFTGKTGSSLKVANQLHNTSGTISDCGYCHNSDAMISGNAYQNIHSDNLTAGGNSTFNNCYNCHQDGFTSAIITEHTNSTGASITNTSMTCESSGCHKTSRTHSGELLIPAVNEWTAGGNDFCAPCHNSSDSVNNATKKIYSQGHDPVFRSEDNITSCGNCHNSSTPGGTPASFRLHDPSMTKNTADPNASSCQGCHNGTIAYVGPEKQILSHLPNGSQYRGNTTESGYSCEYCHNMTGKPSMHSSGMDRSQGDCDTCHYNNTSPFKSLVKNITQLSGGMTNHTYDGRDINTCNVTMCHNASGRVKFHLSKYASGDIGDPQDSAGNPTFVDRATWSSDINDRGVLVDCRDCHEKYNDTAPFYAPFQEANLTLVNNQEHVGKNYTLKNCYVCHTYQDDVNDPVTIHNVSIEPLTGGPNCTKCHDLGATGSDAAPVSMRVNVTAFNDTASRHRNLTNITLWNGSTLFGLIDTGCWVCHQSDGTQPERHTDLKDLVYKAYRCEDCHTIGGNVSSFQASIYNRASKVDKHYPDSIFSGSMEFNASVKCSMCHKNSLVPDINTSGNSSSNVNDINVSHYGNLDSILNTTDMLGCNKCHAVYNSIGGKVGGQFGPDYGYARTMPYGHNEMGASSVDCQNRCHNSNGEGSNYTPVNLHNNSISIYVGTDSCYSTGCHEAPGGGDDRPGRR